jgi:two-component system CheB/CheR fusion protein
MHLLQHQGGIDFREYKPATVMRRIERRMQVRHVPDLENYARLLDGDRTELNALRRELLIPVTSFFRDPVAFEVLAQTAIETIVKERGENQPIRVWVPGTSTGEEAYSIAILFAEACARARRWPPLKLFATDVEQHNVDFGSAGVFSEAITTEVSPERLEQWFYKRGNHFVIKNEIRQNIVFARHNLLQDPPFTRMDLVSCRNLLIYFRSRCAGSRAARLQYALAPGGFLFLGSSETLAQLQKRLHRGQLQVQGLPHPAPPGAAAGHGRRAAHAYGRRHQPRPTRDSARSPPDRRRRHRGRRDRAAALLRAHQPAAERQPGAAARVRRRQPLSAHRRGRGHPGPRQAAAADAGPGGAGAAAQDRPAATSPCARTCSACSCPTASAERLRLVRAASSWNQREAHLLLSFEPEPQRGLDRPERLGPGHRHHGHGAGDRRSASRPWSASSPPPARACRRPSRSWKPPTRNCRPPTRS